MKIEFLCESSNYVDMHTFYCFIMLSTFINLVYILRIILLVSVLIFFFLCFQSEISRLDDEINRLHDQVNNV
jgi:hypothetical protein